MKLMIDGVWRGDIDPTPELQRKRMIHAGQFREKIEAGAFRAEAGRYHLYLSYACPFSHRVHVVWALKKLTAVIGVSIVHPLWDNGDGWTLGATDWSTADGGQNGFRFLHEAYRATDPAYTGKVTVPVLWDCSTKRIVNNESIEIATLLNAAPDEPGARQVDLYPYPLRREIDGLNEQIASRLAKGVYAVGQASDQDEYDAAVDSLFGFLDELEDRLGDGRPFLMGDEMTLSDVLAYTPLARFDAVYHPLMRASRKRLVDYERLASLARRIHDLPGVAAVTRFDHILKHYYDGDWAVATRRGIVPAEPQTDFRSAAVLSAAR